MNVIIDFINYHIRPQLSLRVQCLFSKNSEKSICSSEDKKNEKVLRPMKGKRINIFRIIKRDLKFLKERRLEEFDAPRNTQNG